MCTGNVEIPTKVIQRNSKLVLHLFQQNDLTPNAFDGFLHNYIAYVENFENFKKYFFPQTTDGAFCLRLPINKNYTILLPRMRFVDGYNYL